MRRGSVLLSAKNGIDSFGIRKPRSALRLDSVTLSKRFLSDKCLYTRIPGESKFS